MWAQPYTSLNPLFWEMYHLSQLQSEGNVSEGERLERHCFLKKKNKEGSEPRNEATWETRKSWEKSSAQRLQKNTALWTLGCWPMETLFRLLANRTVRKSMSFHYVRLRCPWDSQARILEWLPCPPPGDLPNPRTEPTSFTSPAMAGRFLTTSTTWEA